MSAFSSNPQPRRKAPIRARPSQADRRPGPLAPFANALPGWLFLLGGLVILGVAVLLPEWRATAEALAQREAMAGHLSVARLRAQAYERYADAVQRRDPSVMAYLAFTQLNRMPPGLRMLKPHGPGQLAVNLIDAPTSWAYSEGEAGRAEAAGAELAGAEEADGSTIGPWSFSGTVIWPDGRAPDRQTIDQWLERHLADPAHASGNPRATPRAESRLDRLTAGPSRWGLVAVGVMFAGAGLLWRSRVDEPSDAA